MKASETVVARRLRADDRGRVQGLRREPRAGGLRPARHDHHRHVHRHLRPAAHSRARRYVPLIILALVVFAIITGARPSSLRAVIMNSLFLLTWAYLDQSLRSSALLGVPVAAFLILLQNPLVIVDPSFTLSFGAILSLALLTGPRLRAPRAGWTATRSSPSSSWTEPRPCSAILHWPLLVTPRSSACCLWPSCACCFVGRAGLMRRTSA